MDYVGTETVTRRFTPASRIERGTGQKIFCGFTELTARRVSVVHRFIGSSGQLLDGGEERRSAHVQRSGIGLRKWPAGEENGGGVKISVFKRAQVGRKE